MGHDRVNDRPVYDEELSSLRTEALFVALALLFLALLAWQVKSGGAGVIAAVLLGLFLFFMFYAVNYRILKIRILADKLNLQFGVFGWTIPLCSIEEIYVDRTSLWRIGGAGIHFSLIRGRYRVMFNFLEYERVVVRLSRRRGLVEEVVFSTKRPEELLRLLTTA